jgi:hypothetical protein
MADNAFNTLFPPEMRTFAERTVSTFEGQAAQFGFLGLQQKVVSFSERNIAASFDFAQQLLHAKDGEEVIRLHAEFVKAQMQALAEQARELAQHATPGAGNGKRPS